MGLARQMARTIGKNGMVGLEKMAILMIQKLVLEIRWSRVNETDFSVDSQDDNEEDVHQKGLGSMCRRPSRVQPC